MLNTSLQSNEKIIWRNQEYFFLLFHYVFNYRDCEKDQPAYVVFQLDRILDVNKETSYFEWEELQSNFERLASSINVGLLKTITLNFNKLLNEMLNVSDVNIAKYR